MKNIFLFLLFTNAIFAQGAEQPAYVEGEVIVKYRSSERSLRAMEELYRRVNVLSVKRLGALKDTENLTFDSSRASVEEVVAELGRDPNVEYAEPNYYLYISGEPNISGEPKPSGTPCIYPGIPFPPGCEDKPIERPAIAPPPVEINPPRPDPKVNQNWGVRKVQADEAWKLQRGSKNIIVGVIDTGVDYNHPDLAANIWRNPKAQKFLQTGVDPAGEEIVGDLIGWDFIHNDNRPFDDHGHGSHCAGIIGAVGGNGVGISGMSPAVSIMAVKFASSRGRATTVDAIRSIDYAVSRGANILSNSYGGTEEPINSLREAGVRAEKAGVLFVAAAGNDSANIEKKATYPAGFTSQNMLTVAGTTEDDDLMSMSNYSSRLVHLGAPGEDIYSLAPNNRFQNMSGTSMACPHVAGAAALVWSAMPAASYHEVKRRLLEYGDSLPALNGKTISGRRLNILRALTGS